MDFISQRFDRRCAVRALMIATSIDFGIAEDTHGDLHFAHEPAEIERWILDMEEPDWRSHFRLRRIAELLYENKERVKSLLRENHCPVDCHGAGCPLEDFVAEKTGWRTSWKKQK